MDIILNGNTSTDSTGTPDGNITYNWSTIDGAFTGVFSANTITAISGGTYTLVVTDASYGVTDTSSHTIDGFLTPPTVVITPDNYVITDGEDVTLTATGAATYLWSPGGETTDNITVSGGTYSVVGTDGNGCTGITETIVSTNNLGVVILSNDTTLSCSVQEIDLTTTVTGNTNTLAYEWVKEGYGALGFTDALTINGSCTYTVTVTEFVTNLVTEDSIEIYGSLTDNPPVSTISGATEFPCTATTITLSAETAANLEYEWVALTGTASGSLTGSTLDILQPGTYQLTVTSTINPTCNDVSTHTVLSQETPYVSINQQTSNIPNPTVTITSLVLNGTPGYDYEWAANPNNIVGSNTNSSVDVNDSCTLYLAVTDSNGCVGYSTPRVITLIIADTEAPTVPLNLVVVNTNQSTVDLDISWNASTDNVGVDHYVLQRSVNG